MSKLVHLPHHQTLDRPSKLSFCYNFISQHRSGAEKIFTRRAKIVWSVGLE